MKNFSKRILVGALVVSTALLACGKKELEPYFYEGAGQYSQSTGEVKFPGEHALYGKTTVAKYDATERSKFCAIDTEAETDETAREAFLSELNGTWAIDTIKDRDLSKPDADLPTYLKFRFSAAASSADLYKVGFLFTSEVENIQFKRICVSKELKDPGNYQGFRIVELEAKNNEGIAIFAVKFHQSPVRKHPILLMTHRVYTRYGQTSSLSSESSVFRTSDDGESSVRISVFPALLR